MTAGAACPFISAPPCTMTAMLTSRHHMLFNQHSPLMCKNRDSAIPLNAASSPCCRNHQLNFAWSCYCIWTTLHKSYHCSCEQAYMPPIDSPQLMMHVCTEAILSFLRPCLHLDTITTCRSEHCKKLSPCIHSCPLIEPVRVFGVCFKKAAFISRTDTGFGAARGATCMV